MYVYVCMRVFHKVLKHEGEDLNVPFLIIQTDQKKRRDENTSALTGSKSDHNRIFNLQTKVPATPTIAARLQLQVVMAEFKGQRI